MSGAWYGPRLCAEFGSKTRLVRQMAGAAPRLAAAAGALLPTLLLLNMMCPVAAKLAVPDAELYFKAWGHPDPDTYFFGPGVREDRPYKLRKAEAAHVEELGLTELQQVTRAGGAVVMMTP